MDITRDLVEIHVQRLAERFGHPFWEGPMLSTPEETAQRQAMTRQPIRPRWELWFEQSQPNSRNPRVKGGSAPAAVAFDTVDELLATPIERIAYLLTIAIAGRAAHEALEWARLDGNLVIDPHGDLAELRDAADGIATYLETAGQ